MDNKLIQPTPTAKLKAQEDEEYKILMRFPKTFNKKDPKTVQTFCMRMREVRNKRNKEGMESIELKKDLKRNQKYRGQINLALILGVTTMTISKYEYCEYDKQTEKYITKIKSIPIQHLRNICNFYDVTPHYLVGYVDEPDDFLWIDENGNIEIKDGKPFVGHKGMNFEPSYKINCIEEYNNLALNDFELFVLINKILLSNERKKHLCKRILSAVFEEA